MTSAPTRTSFVTATLGLPGPPFNASSSDWVSFGLANSAYFPWLRSAAAIISASPDATTPSSVAANSC